jgi:hypothetical protein
MLQCILGPPQIPIYCHNHFHQTKFNGNIQKKGGLVPLKELLLDWLDWNEGAKIVFLDPRVSYFRE